MKISRIIEQLQELQGVYGDLEFVAIRKPRGEEDRIYDTDVSIVLRNLPRPRRGQPVHVAAIEVY